MTATVYFAEAQENERADKFLADMILREMSNSYGNGHLPVGVFGPYATESEAEAAHPGADIWPVSADHIDDLQDYQGRYIAA